MKIVITTIAPDIESEVDPRFGRSPYLLVVDSDTLAWQAHPNPGVSASGGAGIQAAQFVADQHAHAVISGDFGPNAVQAFTAAGLPMYLHGSSHTVRDVVARFQAGQLERVDTPTRGAHQRGG